MLQIEKGKIDKERKITTKICEIRDQFEYTLGKRRQNQMEILKQVRDQFIKQAAFDNMVLDYDHQNKQAE